MALGRPVRPILESVGAPNSRQRRRNKKQRREREFRSLENISGERNPWVFVDDVFTTGATALAAWKALDRPEDFQVWTLIYRQSLEDIANGGLS
jgi:predicted amidophosphoribosyltransferase